MVVATDQRSMHTRVKSAALPTASLVTAPSFQTTTVVNSLETPMSTKIVQKGNQNLPVFSALNHLGRFPRFRGSPLVAPLQEECPTGACVRKSHKVFGISSAKKFTFRLNKTRQNYA